MLTKKSINLKERGLLMYVETAAVPALSGVSLGKREFLNQITKKAEKSLKTTICQQAN